MVCEAESRATGQWFCETEFRVTEPIVCETKFRVTGQKRNIIHQTNLLSLIK